MSQDEATENMQMKDEGYYAPATAIDGLDNPMDMNIRLSLGQRAFSTPSRYDFFTSETPPDLFDQSMSPRSQTIPIFNINDVRLGSSYDLDMNAYSFAFDRRRTPNPGFRDLDYADDNPQV